MPITWEMMERIMENNDIVIFLEECAEKDYELDKDDILHILKGEFNYVRFQYPVKSKVIKS